MIDLDLIDLPDAHLDDTRGDDGQAMRITTRGHRRSFRQLLQVANAAREIDRLPEPDETHHLIMSGNFNAWDVVPAMLKLADCPAHSLHIATLGFNKRNAAELLDLIDRQQIARVAFVCSCYFRDANKAEFKYLADGLIERGQQIAATRSHAKIIALKLTDGRTATTESSANLRSCRNLEQMTIHGSPDVQDFHAGWIMEQMKHGIDGTK